MACIPVNPTPGVSYPKWWPVPTNTKSLANVVTVDPVVTESPIPLPTAVTSIGFVVAAPVISYRNTFRKALPPIVTVIWSWPPTTFAT